jgi:alkylhydroperoxidase family enzyme
VPLAKQAGLSERAVAEIPHGDSWDGWSDRQRLLVQAADELYVWQAPSAATLEALRVELSPRQLIELCFLVGSYSMLSMTLSTLQVEPEPTALARLGKQEAELGAKLARLATRDH